MVRETTNFRECYIPLVATTGNRGGVSQTHELRIYGFKSRYIAEGCRLHADFVFLDRAQRRELAMTTKHLPMATANFVTFKLNTTGGKCRLHTPEGATTRTIQQEGGAVYGASHKVPQEVFCNAVTGLIIRPRDAFVTHVDFFINGHHLCAWSLLFDDSYAWEKVGLKNPHDGSILIPFSRNMWDMPDKAAFVNISRVDSAVLKFKGENTESMGCEVTALGYSSRALSNTGVLYSL
jgi:hypothetical protein